MNFTTLLARSSSSILVHLSKIRLERDAVLLFSLSANASNPESIASRLSSLAPQTVGCLSFPHQEAPNIVICSMATFHARDCIPFRSSIPGLPPVQVGRWNRTRSSLADAFDFSRFTAKRDDFWEYREDAQLPSELLGHEREITSLIFFSDNAAEGFIQSLRVTPEAHKLGLVASSTIFTTGQPFSLFYNQAVYSSGAVGLALRNYAPPVSSTAFPGLIPLSKPMTVSRSESNMIHELNHSNPSKMLMEALTTDIKSLNKDEDFFLGLFRSGSGVSGQISRVYRILSGDPGRGSIALEAEKAPRENETVQFFRRPPYSSGITLRSQLQDSDDHSLCFSCSSQDELTAHEVHVTDGDDIRVLQRRFLAISENGVLCTEATLSKPLWKCTVPGAMAALKWT